MARATVRTLIPLDRVAAVTGIDPLHFNGVVSSVRPQGYEPGYSDCDDIWFQYDWQSVGKFSRENLAYVLRQAEDVTAKYLGYYPLPKWISAEEHVLTSSYVPELYSHMNSRGLPKSVLTNWGKVIELGVKALSLIEEDVAIVYSDSDGDGYDETATVTVATSVTDEEEIAVFYPNRTEDWEIRPVEIEISGGTATITFRRELAVLPELIERMPSPDDPTLVVDGDDDTNFLATVDVYRRYNDQSQQVVFYVEPSTCLGSCAPAEITGCGYIRDANRGIVAYKQATYDEDTETWASSTQCYQPLRAELYYRAGLRNLDMSYPSLEMDSTLERLIIYYALTLADKNVCGCNNFSSHLDYLRVDLSEIGEDRTYQTTPQILDNPLGTTRAAVMLWKYILSHRLGSSLRKGY